MEWALRTLSEAVDADEQLSQLYTQLADVDNLLNDFNHELAEYQKTVNSRMKNSMRQKSG